MGMARTALKTMVENLEELIREPVRSEAVKQSTKKEKGLPTVPVWEFALIECSHQTRYHVHS